jgi:hypothetical protein
MCCGWLLACSRTSRHPEVELLFSTLVKAVPTHGCCHPDDALPVVICVEANNYLLACLHCQKAGPKTVINEQASTLHSYDAVEQPPPTGCNTRSLASVTAYDVPSSSYTTLQSPKHPVLANKFGSSISETNSTNQMVVRKLGPPPTVPFLANNLCPSMPNNIYYCTRSEHNRASASIFFRHSLRAARRCREVVEYWCRPTGATNNSALAAC